MERPLELLVAEGGWMRHVLALQDMLFSALAALLHHHRPVQVGQRAAREEGYFSLRLGTDVGPYLEFRQRSISSGHVFSFSALRTSKRPAKKPPREVQTNRVTY